MGKRKHKYIVKTWSKITDLYWEDKFDNYEYAKSLFDLLKKRYKCLLSVR